MNVLLISQCHKNALKQTRRILDQFAERLGERTWQTSITAQGLETLRGLLRQTARKNTAVACHWIRGRNHSELLWIVGSAVQFNAQGAVPTNRTRRKVLRAGDENDWHHLGAIRLLAALAALWHDLGKANATFQHKLADSCKPKRGRALADPLRHEWVSLRLLEAFVGADDDRAWLECLANLPLRPDMGWLERLRQDGRDATLESPFNHLPPLARAVGWLMVGHHRLPTDLSHKPTAFDRPLLSELPEEIEAHWCGARLKPSEGLSATEKKQHQRNLDGCWDCGRGLSLASPVWQKRARKLARQALDLPGFLQTPWLANVQVLHLARLCLMLADHHYSSLSDPRQRLSGAPEPQLWANTRWEGEGKVLNQPLDEHLVGVEAQASLAAHALPTVERGLPSLGRVTGFTRRNRDPRFKWQDKAYDLAAALREPAAGQGFFGLNLASTGCGKTLANGRIMYALAHPGRGARFTIALGLRTLTLQTGAAYRQRLGLGEDSLAVLVGGGAVRQLHELNQQSREAAKTKWPPEEAEPGDLGGESREALLPPDSYVHYDGDLGSGPLGRWLEHTRGAQALVEAPILCCTIDHLMPATESLRGGGQIAPMLRLMSADLILDEPDDFDLGDLFALSRLVHWAGLLGSRVLLSSATLPPALVRGLFEAYRQGRAAYQQNRGVPGQALEVPCAWFDEYGCQAGQHAESAGFARQHRAWAAGRAAHLGRKDEGRRVGHIVPLEIPARPDPELFAALAALVRREALGLHGQHHETNPSGGQRVSFGLVRLAHIDDLIDLTRALAAAGAPEGVRLHLCCYHSHHPLLVRSDLEARLDRLLNRQEPGRVFRQPEVRAALAAHPQADHIFMVLASPVAEVGRDHDYDWAVVEPSSLRSIIQLAGRVRRHRPGACASPNILLLGTNLHHLRKGRGEPAFCRPGFENRDNLLDSHELTDLLTPEQYQVITSIPRIIQRPEPNPKLNLADLEHARLAKLMLGGADQKVWAGLWWTTQAHLSGELQRAFRFRDDPEGRRRFVLLPEEYGEQVLFHEPNREGGLVEVHKSLFHDLELTLGPRVSLWGGGEYLPLLMELAETLDMDLEGCARRFGVVELPDRGVLGWSYHPALGLRRWT